MALLFGARLAAAGIQPTFLGSWQAGIAALKTVGIQVQGPGGLESYPARIANPKQAEGFQLALLLVKSWQTEKAALELAHYLEPDGMVITLQNGLGNLDILVNQFGPSRAFQGVTTYGGTLLEPGIVQPGGEGLVLLPSDPNLDRFIDLFKRGGFQVQEVTDLESLIWGKLLVNVAINPLSALLGIKNGELLTNESARTLMGAAASEAVQVARAKGIRLVYQDPIEAAEGVAEATADNVSSMLQDLRRGAPTEIEGLCRLLFGKG